MTVQDELKVILEKIKYYVEDIENGATRRGYGSMHGGFWYNRDKNDKVSVLAVSTFYPDITLPMEITRTHVTFNDNTFQYDIVRDKDSYFAQSTIDDIRLFEIEDFELLRKIYTKMTGYVHREN